MFRKSLIQNYVRDAVAIYIGIRNLICKRYILRRHNRAREIPASVPKGNSNGGGRSGPTGIHREVQIAVVVEVNDVYARGCQAESVLAENNLSLHGNRNRVVLIDGAERTIAITQSDGNDDVTRQRTGRLFQIESNVEIFVVVEVAQGDTLSRQELHLRIDGNGLLQRGGWRLERIVSYAQPALHRDHALARHWDGCRSR